MAGQKLPNIGLCPGLIFPSRGDRDFGVEFQTHPGSQASSRREAKIPLSSRVATGISWSPLRGLKGDRSPVEFGERTRDCSPDHAGKEDPHLPMTGASRGFPRAAAPLWGFSRGTTGSSGSLSFGAREVRSPCTWGGGARHCARDMVGESGLKTR